METDVWPGETTVTTPPHVHSHCEESSSAATSPMVTRAAPGVHGVSTGTHGCGAPEAAATAGFAPDVQRPNDGMLAAETSVTTPAAPVAETSAPDAENVHSFDPSEHSRLAPVQTCEGINARSMTAWSEFTRAVKAL